jgi:hypothetical protein
MDRYASFTDRVKRLTVKWLIFMTLGVFAYGTGLYFGTKKLRDTEVAEKIMEIDVNRQEVSVPVKKKVPKKSRFKPSSGSADSPSNTVSPKSPTESH